MRKSNTRNAVHNYDTYRRAWSEINFEKKFERWPRSDLIKQIKMYEVEKQTQFLRLWQKVKLSWNNFMEQFDTTEKKVLGHAFDEAFK